MLLLTNVIIRIVHLIVKMFAKYILKGINPKMANEETTQTEELVTEVRELTTDAEHEFVIPEVALNLLWEDVIKLKEKVKSLTSQLRG